MESDVRHLSNRQLLQGLVTLAARERRCCLSMLEHMAEVEQRGLYRDEGFSSLFGYCVERLRLSEDQVYKHTQAARLLQRFPALCTPLACGDLTLSALSDLSAHLTDDNHALVIERVRNKSREQRRAVIAALAPSPSVPTTIRKLPEPRARPAATASLPLLERSNQSPARAKLATRGAKVPSTLVARRPAQAVEPLDGERFKVQLTVGTELRGKIRTAQQLMRHSVPDGNLAAVVERALDLLIDAQMKRHFAQTTRPKKARSSGSAHGSRTIPADVRRAVVERDGMRCTFVSEDGRRCCEHGQLEFDHARAFARGGPATVDNIRLLCRPHNQLMAERHFGPLFMAAKRAQRSATSQHRG